MSNDKKTIDDLLDSVHPMSMSEMEKTEDGAVWIMNKSNPLGPIIIEIKNGTGGKETVRIPGSWLPFDATTMSMKIDLLSNPTFRKLVQMRSVIMVQSTLAEEILETVEGREEQAKILGRVIPEDALMKEDLDVTSKPNDKVSPVAMSLVEQNRGDEKAMLGALRTNASAFTAIDFQYIAENAQFPKVKDYCASRAIKDKTK
jgi:hypothetical protein